MDRNQIVEWAPFQLLPGIEEEQLLEASRQLQEGFLAEQPGFVRRDLLRGDPGWVDVVWWEDRTAAEAAMAAAAESPVCHVYFQLMVGADHDDPGSGVLHFDRVLSYARGE